MGILILIPLVLIFVLKYFHAHFIFQGDVPLQLYLHHSPSLVWSQWDPYTYGYLGWYPIIGRFFPLNTLMHFVQNSVFLNHPAHTLTLLQINASLCLLGLAAAVYALLRFLRSSRPGALIGALIMAMAGFHVQSGLRELDLFYLQSFLFVPLTLICLIKSYERLSFGWAILSGLVIGLSILGGSNVPMFLYLPFFFFVPLVKRSSFASVPREWPKWILLYACAVTVGLLAGMALILPSFAHTGLTDRATFIRGLFDSHATSLTQFFQTLVFREWWNPQGVFDHEFDYFLSLPVVALALLGLMTSRGKIARSLMILMAIGAFVLLHMHYLPEPLRVSLRELFTLTSIRNQSRFFLVFLLPIAYFASAGIDFLISADKSRRAFLFACLYAGFALLYIGIGIQYLQAPQAPQESTALVTSLVLAGVFAVLFAGATFKSSARSCAWLCVLATFLCFYAARPDIPTRYPYNQAFQNNLNRNHFLINMFLKPPMLLKPVLEQGQSPFRVLNFNGSAMRQNFWGPVTKTELAFEPFYDPSTTPQYLSFYADLIFDPETHNHLNTNSPLIDLYNIRYIRLPRYTGEKLKPTSIPNIYRNPQAFERYFLTSGARYFEDEDQLRQALATATARDLRNYVYLVGPETQVPRDTPLRSALQIVERKPTRVELKVKLSQPGFLVASDLWFPAWTVQVDGKKRPLLKTYGVFRGVQLTAGSHTVRFEFVDRFGIIGAWISVLSLLIGAGLVWICLKKDKKSYVKSKLSQESTVTL